MIKPKKVVIAEITNPHPLATKIKQKLKKQYKKYSKNFASGKDQTEVLFSLETGQHYYSEQKPFNFGLKTAILRTVQQSLNLVLIEQIKQGALIPTDLMDLPIATNEKIDLLYTKGLITSPAITDSYIYFLQQYHLAQNKYQNSLRPVSMPFNQAQFLHHYQKVDSFLSQINQQLMN